MRLFFLAVLGAGLLSGQESYLTTQPVTRDLILLGRAQSVVSEMLKRMPNFTCLQTIERSRRELPLKKYRPLDTLRLEVALVDGRELYAWPGAARFSDQNLREMVGGSGATGTGDFALHAKSLFLTGVAKFDYQGEELLKGRNTHKFHYRVPIGSSSFIMRVNGAEGVVGYQGHVWHDAESLELMRMEIEIDEIPAHVPLSHGFKRIDYARMRIGEELYTLPSVVEMTLSAVDGTESQNRAVFSACRQYTGESSLLLDDPPAEQPAATAPVNLTLPEGLTVPLKLSTTLELSKAATGDPVVFEVGKDVVRDGAVLLPRGARIQMRLDLVSCRDWNPPHCFVALVPGSFQFANKNGPFRATLTSPSLESMMNMVLGNIRPELRFIPAELGQAAPGSAFLLLRGSRGKLASGYATTWRTLEARGEDQP